MLPFSNLIWKTANTTPIYFSQTKVSLFILGFQRYLQISFFIKIARFLDDGLGIEYEFLKACNNLNFVCYSLTATGFRLNSNKSIWTPCQKITRLGIDIVIINNITKITSDRISSIFYTIELLTDKSISARELSKLSKFIQIIR